MKRALTLLVLLILSVMSPALAAGKWVATPYAPAKVVFEFYLDDPQKIGSALYWVRALMNPLQAAPYNYTPEDLNVVVVIHGNEIVTVATRNEAKYQDAVERMRYYADLGVSFRVCGQAAEDFGYAVKDFQDFIEVVPNAITELAHWQQQGYALITPHVMEKKFDIETIR
ncbi:DsrE family protein [Thiobacillus sp.]|uniref:DsrE family protein n=1 Tax=Thiobacillus sp. TaxID=924 RepID=UPI0025E63B1F|nr:DsrE family protein [Thiobacillus sp.]MBT9541205.1 DsrE family protein [Thiobacillus sp.]